MIVYHSKEISLIITLTQYSLLINYKTKLPIRYLCSSRNNRLIKLYFLIPINPIARDFSKHMKFYETSFILFHNSSPDAYYLCALYYTTINNINQQKCKPSSMMMKSSSTVGGKKRLKLIRSTFFLL